MPDPKIVIDSPRAGNSTTTVAGVAIWLADWLLRAPLYVALSRRYGFVGAGIFQSGGYAVSWGIQATATRRYLREGPYVPNLLPYPFGDFAFGYPTALPIAFAAVSEAAVGLFRLAERQIPIDYVLRLPLANSPAR